MSREIERWVTVGGRRIPIFKKDGIKPLNKKELVKKIYKDGQGNYTLDLPKGYRTVYGTDYIQYKDKASVKYDLENNVTTMEANPEYQKTIKGFKRPQGKPELWGFGTYEGSVVQYTDDDYPDKKSFLRDLRANEVKRANVKDKRDRYIIDHSNYRGMDDLKGQYKKAMRYYKYAKENGDTLAAKLFKGDLDSLKDLMNKASSVYLQKQKKYKMKK